MCIARDAHATRDNRAATMMRTAAAAGRARASRGNRAGDRTGALPRTATAHGDGRTRSGRPRKETTARRRVRRCRAGRERATARRARIGRVRHDDGRRPRNHGHTRRRSRRRPAPRSPRPRVHRSLDTRPRRCAPRSWRRRRRRRRKEEHHRTGLRGGGNGAGCESMAQPVRESGPSGARGAAPESRHPSERGGSHMSPDAVPMFQKIRRARSIDARPTLGADASSSSRRGVRRSTTRAPPTRRCVLRRDAATAGRCMYAVRMRSSRMGWVTTLPRRAS